MAENPPFPLSRGFKERKRKEGCKFEREVRERGRLSFDMGFASKSNWK